MKKLILAAAIIASANLVMAAGTVVTVEPGDVLIVHAKDKPNAGAWWNNELTSGTETIDLGVGSSVGTATHNGCTREQLRKLLYQARQHLSRPQSVNGELTGVFKDEKKSERLRREAYELEQYDGWISEIDKAIDKDECD